MNDSRLKRAAVVLACLLPVSVPPAILRADVFGIVMQQAQASAEAAQSSQRKIDEADDKSRALLHDFKAAVRQSANLSAYNVRLEKQITRQELRLAAIDKSIAEITGFQRDLLPLTSRMIDALERFIELDLPFRLAERRERIRVLRAALDDPTLPTADKYRRVLDALRAEIDFNGTIESYRDRIALGAGEREVTVLRIGRLALLARSIHGGQLGRWDRKSGAWELLDAAYADDFENGLRVAGGRLPADLLRVPLPAATEAVR